MEPDEEGLAIGKTYACMADLRRAVDTHFALLGYGNVKPTNTATKLKVLCTEHVDCPFVLHTFKRKRQDGGTEPQVTITTLRDEHSMAVTEKGKHRKRNTATVSQTVILPLVQELMNSSENRITAKEIQNQLRSKHSLEVSYQAAWRARTAVLERAQLHGKDSYMLIADWLRRVELANPGTATRFDRDDENQFRRACIIHGCFDGVIRHSLPILALDACHLKTEEKGTMYVASVINGNFDILIAGFGIANREENGDDWSWFLDALVQALPLVTSIPHLVVVSDRDKGLMPVVSTHLPSAHHSYCSVHIKRNVQSQFHVNLSKEIHALATAAVSENVTECLATIHAIDEAIPDYLIDSDLTKWVTARFPVPRYGVVTSNAAESMNNWIGEDRKLAHFAVFVHVTRRTMERMTKLRDKYKAVADGDEEVVQWVKTTLNKKHASARKRLIVPGSDHLFEVQRECGIFGVVNLEDRSCTCGEWQENQYPCVHAMAVILKRRLQVLDYVSPLYKKVRVKQALEPGIVPVDVSTCVSDGLTLPPPSYRTAGRPRVVRLRGRAEIEKDDSPIVCSRCGERGHNVRTCSRRQALQEANEAARAQRQAATPAVTEEMIARLQDEVVQAAASRGDEEAFGIFWTLERIFDSDPIV